MDQTAHFQLRMRERNVGHTVIMMVIKHGTCFRRTGVEFFTILNKDLKWAETSDERRTLERAKKLILISDNGQLITCYGNRNKRKELKKIKKKVKFNRNNRWGRIDEDIISEVI